MGGRQCLVLDRIDNMNKIDSPKYVVSSMVGKGR